MKILFYVFGFPVHFFGAMIALGFLAGIILSFYEVKRKNLDTERIFDLATYGIISAVIGARIFYIIFYDLSYYLKNPAEIILITEGGLSIHGGLIGAFLFGIYYFRRHKLSFLQYADAIVPGIILGQGIGRVGCDVFGKVMMNSFPWGIERQGQLLHPTQVYEFILNYIVFYLLWRKRKNIKYNGQLFVWYIVLFSINRGIVEMFRYNPTIIGWFSISHLLSVLFIIVAMILRFVINHRNLIILTSADKIDDKDKKTDSLNVWMKELTFVLFITIISLLIYHVVQS